MVGVLHDDRCQHSRYEGGADHNCRESTHAWPACAKDDEECRERDHDVDRRADPPGPPLVASHQALPTAMQ